MARLLGIIRNSAWHQSISGHGEWVSQQAAAASSTPNGVVQRARRRGLGGALWPGPLHDSPRQGSGPCYTATNNRRTGPPLRCLTDASHAPRRCPGDEGRGRPAVGRERHNERPLQKNTSISPPACASPGRRAIPSAVLAPSPEQAVSFVSPPKIGHLRPVLTMPTLMKPGHFEAGASTRHSVIQLRQQRV